ncbi:hypothetical protein ABER75_16715 [Niallia taxi]|nr:hypothetical protein [Niallia taxi]MCM3215237.1 hypothetical protein [Niallia taxi]MDK8639538.1 hypothetical protein [Niallia taxi]MED4037912.1 hypothetical protein [Niallia taxi]MED4055876.1 hypothetical protein [Niallia taxi]MED4117872.1 hypothetical protein [Niallia taxi]
MEKTILLVINRVKIAIRPYNTALPTFLLSSILNLSFHPFSLVDHE